MAPAAPSPGDHGPSDRPAVTIDVGGDWPTTMADSVERVVGAVRDKTAAPLQRAAYGIVYGLLAAILGAASAVLLAIGAVRALNILVPEDVWAAHAIAAGIFLLGGLFLWSKRRPKTRS